MNNFLNATGKGLIVILLFMLTNAFASSSATIILEKPTEYEGKCTATFLMKLPIPLKNKIALNLKWNSWDSDSKQLLNWHCKYVNATLSAGTIPNYFAVYDPAKSQTCYAFVATATTSNLCKWQQINCNDTLDNISLCQITP